MVVKASNTNEDLIKEIQKLGRVDLLVLSGVFLDKESESDILLVGEINKTRLAELLDSRLEQPVRFTAMTKEDFLYRLKCNDRFISKLVDDKANIVAINKLTKYL
jgi:hypothetical protein